ncbi:MAG: 50S ribosomal protein L24 [Candidatus Saganbacteria bacterium]|nr:50S ribosomal protein L24 [Candidatus Saganbacteria bacterium]
MAKLKIKKGDMVLVLSGKDKDKKGKVIEVRPKDGTVIVERINVAKRHQRPSRNFQGGIIEKALPLCVSNVMLVCPRCSEPARVKRQAGNRVCGRCKEVVDKVK